MVGVVISRKRVEVGMYGSAVVDVGVRVRRTSVGSYLEVLELSKREFDVREMRWSRWINPLLVG